MSNKWWSCVTLCLTSLLWSIAAYLYITEVVYCGVAAQFRFIQRIEQICKQSFSITKLHSFTRPKPNDPKTNEKIHPHEAMSTTSAEMWVPDSKTKTSLVDG